MSASKGTMAVGTENHEGFTVEKRVPLHAHFLVKIESFSLLSKNGIRKYESREFLVDGYYWRLIIYPDGHEKDTNGDHLSVYLSITETNEKTETNETSYLTEDWEVDVIFNILLYDQVADDYHCFRGKMHRFNAMNREWGFPKLISKKSLADPLNGYLVNDNCVIGAEVFEIFRPPAIEYLSLKTNSSHKHQFEISEFSKLKNSWTSKAFRAGDYDWTLKLVPSGIYKGRDISIYLHVLNLADSERVRASYSICFKDHLNNIFKRVDHDWFTSRSSGWGAVVFRPIAETSGWFPGKVSAVKDHCIVEVEITVEAVSCAEMEE